MASVEIIDLTTPPPMPEPLGVQLDSSNTVPIEESPEATTNQQSKRKRKRKSRKSSNNSPATTACPSSRNSPERHLDSELQTKRKRADRSAGGGGRSDEEGASGGINDNQENPKPEEQDLFYVDVTPVPVPSVRQTAAEKPNESAETSGKLLVPAHVTVLGSTPVEIISQPSADSEDEDFINYLDYDDSKVNRGNILRLHNY